MTMKDPMIGTKWNATARRRTGSLQIACRDDQKHAAAVADDGEAAGGGTGAGR